MTHRLALLTQWIERIYPATPFELSSASADASFRRYLRVRFEDPARQSLIVMDAPPEHEDCRPFVRVGRMLAAAGLHVPSILAENLEQGLLLLSDLGDTTYLMALANENPDPLYADANAALVKLQRSPAGPDLPPYDHALLMRELCLFPDWYLRYHLGGSPSEGEWAILRHAFEQIVASNLAQPRVLVHRDYHSRNLMFTRPNPGVLDFQDAVYGPISYDLVSLYRDAYIEWEEERVLDWTIRYWESARRASLPVGDDFAAFYRDFEWMGLQRHLKVLGIFARLKYRDHKDGYVQNMPLVLRYVRSTCSRYRQLGPLLSLLDRWHDTPVTVGHTF